MKNVVLYVLQTIQVGETKQLVAEPSYVENMWCKHVNRKDVKDFELVINPMPWGCEVSIRPYTGGLSRKEGLWLIGTVVAMVGVLWLTN